MCLSLQCPTTAPSLFNDQQMNAALHLFHHLILRSRPDQHTYSREDESMDGYIYSRTRNLWSLIKFWACFNVQYASVFWSVSHLYVFYRPVARRRLSRLPLCSPHMLFFILTAPAFDLSSSLSISPRDASLFLSYSGSCCSIPRLSLRGASPPLCVHFLSVVGVKVKQLH